MLLSEEIQFLSSGFPSLAMSKASCVKFRLSLEISIPLFFFPFLFSSYCCSVGLCLICVVSGRCNLPFFVFSYVVFELFYWCIDAIFSVGESSSSFFSWHIQPMSSLGCKTLSIVMSFLVLWSILRMVPSSLQRRQLRSLLLGRVFCDIACFRVVFSFFWDILFLFFFHLRLFNGFVSNIPMYF